MKRVAVVLSGCGALDGAEIQEAVLTLLALARAQAAVTCVAPRIPQVHVINHQSKEVVEGAPRNVLIESARIARGPVETLNQLKMNEVDALIMPGGFGVTSSLCNYSQARENMEINPELARVLREFHRAGKPMGFIGLSSLLAARLFGNETVELTVGHDPDIIAVVQQWGAKPVNCDSRNVVLDRRKIVSMPGYMVAAQITDVEMGINKLVQVVLALA